jgi:hypothetical protein
MPHPRYASDEISKMGRELYEKQIRPLVETQGNIGKIVSIDVETGDYEIDDDLLQAANRLPARRPGAALWGERIGYNAVYAVGGTLERTPQ